MAADSEGKYAGGYDEALHADYTAYVTGAVFNAAFFLEAPINELFMCVASGRLSAWLSTFAHLCLLDIEHQ